MKYLITLELTLSGDLNAQEVRELINEQWEQTPAYDEGDQIKVMDVLLMKKEN